MRKVARQACIIACLALPISIKSDPAISRSVGGNALEYGMQGAVAEVSGEDVMPTLTISNGNAERQVLGNAFREMEQYRSNSAAMPFSFYDDLRKRTDLTVDTRNGSAVVRVSVPDPGARSGAGVAAETTTETTTYRLCHLASLMPHTIGGVLQQDWGVHSVAASVLAMRHFNERDGTVVPALSSERMKRCDVRFTMDLYNTDFSPKLASSILLNDVLSPGSGDGGENGLSTPRPVALLGASRSTASAPVAIFAGIQGIPQVSSGSTSSMLEQTGMYPLFARTVPTDSGYAEAAAQYLRTVLGVHHCGVIHVKDDYGTAYAANFRAAALALDPPMKIISVSYIPGDQGAVISAMRQLQDKDYHYFFGIISTVTHDDVMREAHRAGLAGPGRFWLFGDSASLGSRRYNAETQGDLIEAMQGAAIISLGIEASPEFLDEWSKFGSYPHLRDYFLSKQPKDLNTTGLTFAVTPTQWEFMHYDAMMAIGVAACEASDEFFTGPALYDSLLQTEFWGASGLVKFDGKTGTRDYRTMKYTITNAVARPVNDEGLVTFSGIVTASFERIHRKDDDDMTEAWAEAEGTAFIYSDGTTMHPDGLPQLDEEQNLISTGVLIIGFVFAGIVVLSSLAWFTWTVQHRRHRVVSLAQPEFLLMLCAGTLVMGCSIVPLSLQDGRSGNDRVLDIACMAFPWTVTSGFIISFSALFSKTMRMKKLFEHSKKFLRIRVKASDVLLPFALLFTTNFIVLITWTVVAPLKFIQVPLASYDKFGRSTKSYGACAAENEQASTVFIVIIVILNVGCLIMANIQAYLGRHMPSQYNESCYVALSMAIILEAVFIGSPVLVVVREMPSAHFLVRAFAVTIVCAAVLLPLFLPKLRALRTEEKRTSSKINRGVCTKKQHLCGRISLCHLGGT